MRPAHAQLKLLSLCAAAVVFRPGVAAASPKTECIASYESAEAKERGGQLIEAQQLYLGCAVPACGSFPMSECVARHTRLDTDIPSVVMVVTDESGAPAAAVSVTLDGQPFASELDGRSLHLNPGLHEFAFSRDHRVFSTQKVMIRQGERNKTIAATVTARQAEPERDAPLVPANGSSTPSRSAAGEAAPLTESLRNRPASRGIPPLSYVLGGLGALGIGGFALFTVWGNQDNARLLATCSPHCSQASEDHVKSRYLIANVSLGAAAVGLASAVVVYAVRGSSKREQQAYLIGVEPTSSGAVVGVAGAF